jgi:ribonuclease HI
MAIHKSTEILDEDTGEGVHGEKTYTIVSDSQSAIQAMGNPSTRSGQEIVRRILHRLSTLRKRQIKVQLHWIPGHSGNEGNETADLLAKEAVSSEEQHDFGHLVSTYRRAAHKKI